MSSKPTASRPRKCKFKHRYPIAKETLLQAITERNQLDSPFLQLPGEIRNIIYRYALTGCTLNITRFSDEDEAIFISGLSSFSEGLRSRMESVSKILAVHLPLACRQIRAETGAHAMLRFNTFMTVTSPSYSMRHLRPVHTGHLANIRALKTYIIGDRDEVYYKLQSLLFRSHLKDGSPCHPSLRLPGLKSLFLTIFLDEEPVQELEDMVEMLKQKHTVLNDLRVEICNVELAFL